jgi:hypothetical protein
MLISTGFNKQPALARDGDSSFWRVDTRTPAHELEPSVAADGVNCRFEDGRVWPRLGVSQQPWGQLGTNLIPPGAKLEPSSNWPDYTLQGLVKGRRYTLTWTALPQTGSNGGHLVAFSGNYDAGAPNWSLDNPVQVSQYNSDGTGQRVVTFTSTGNALTLANTDDESLTTGPVAATLTDATPFNVCGYIEFDDPTTDFDNVIVLTDDWRDQSGEDGGRGRAWRVVSGNPSAR